MAVTDSTNRFSNRAADYKNFRPGYPSEILSFIKENCKPDQHWKIADVGSGTGISSRFLCEGLGCIVYGIEPNERMRTTAEDYLIDNNLFKSVNASAGNTTLKDESVNLITAFQALHWFKSENAMSEFRRILKKPGWFLAVWNSRDTTATQFLSDYEKLLNELPDYKNVRNLYMNEEELKNLTGVVEVLSLKIPTGQKLDKAGLKGRFFSSSYTPSESELMYNICAVHLNDIFDTHNDNGFVEIVYNTEAYLLKLKNN